MYDKFTQDRIAQLRMQKNGIHRRRRPEMEFRGQRFSRAELLREPRNRLVPCLTMVSRWDNIIL